MFKRNVLELNKKERGHNRRDRNKGQEVYGNNKKVPLDKHYHKMNTKLKEKLRIMAQF
jgi:hypothetical protein